MTQTPPFPLCSNSVLFVPCAYKLISSLFLFCDRRIFRAEQADSSLDLMHPSALATGEELTCWLSHHTYLRKSRSYLASETVLYFFCKNFILFPIPLRNLLTPLGSGSGYESKYSAALISNSPLTPPFLSSRS